MVRLILGSEKSIKYSLRKGLNNPFVPFSFFASIIVGKEKVKVKIRKNHDDFYLLSPLYEREILHLFKPSSNDVVVDVGAHVGKYTLYASKLAKKGKIIAIEPNKESFKTLIENLKLNNCKNVKAYNVATFDKKCKLKLWVTKDEGRSSVIEKRGNNFEIVTAFSLSRILKDNEIKKVDWMKIDVEGAEIKVLKGAEKFLRKTKNLIIEVQNKNEKKVLKILRNHFKKIKIISKERGQKYYLARN
jgi:FkbM family methyltransferase